MIIEQIFKLFYKILDIIFPEACENCNKFLIYPEKVYCNKCLNKMDLSLKKEFSINLLNNIWYISDYSNLSKIIIETKMFYRKNALIYFLNHIKSKIDFTEITKNIDLIIPVPLQKYKYKERSFNQSEIIANQLFNNLNKVNSKILKKIKITKDQKNLDSKKRTINLSGAFELVDKNLILNKKILIVDDVITTGSTIKEITQLLLKSGSSEVSAFSLLKVK